MSKHEREADAPPDDALANSRDTGGVSDDDLGNSDTGDEAVTTGPTPKGDYVGRVAGDDVGYAGETGAERRAEEDD